MANYQYKPSKTEPPLTTYKTPTQQTEKEIMKDNLLRQKRIKEQEQRQQEEENQRVQKALQERRAQVYQITQEMRKAQRERPKTPKEEAEPIPPDPRQQAFSDFYSFLNRVQAAAGVPIPPIQPPVTQQKSLSRRQSARTPKPVQQAGAKDTLALSPPQMLDNEKVDVKNRSFADHVNADQLRVGSAVGRSKLESAPGEQASILENPPETLIDSSENSSYDFPLDASIKESEKLEVMQLECKDNDQDDERAYREIVQRQKEKLSKITAGKQLQVDVAEQCQKFRQEKTRQEKFRQKAAKQPPKKSIREEASSRLSLEIKQLSDEERKLEQEVMQIDEKLYNVDGLANCSAIQQQNFLSPSADGASIFEAKQTEQDIIRAIASYDADGVIVNKDEVAKAISDFKRRQSRGIIEQSVKGKVRKLMEVRKQTAQAPQAVSPSVPREAPGEQPKAKVERPDQAALDKLFGIYNVAADAPPTAEPCPVEHNAEFDENAFFKQELVESMRQQDVFSTAPQVDLSRAVETAKRLYRAAELAAQAVVIQPALPYYAGELNQNYQPSVIEESSDSQYGDIYASMNSVEMRRASVVRYEPPCDSAEDDDYDFENM